MKNHVTLSSGGAGKGHAGGRGGWTALGASDAHGRPGLKAAPKLRRGQGKTTVVTPLLVLLHGSATRLAVRRFILHKDTEIHSQFVHVLSYYIYILYFDIRYN